MRLYEISSTIRELLSTLNDQGGEIDEATELLLANLAEKREDKIDAYCSLIREWEAFVSVRQAEIDRLKAGVVTHRNNVAKLKRLMQMDLEALGEREFQTALFKVYLQRSPVSVQPVDQDANKLPAEYQRIAVTADCEKAREHWKLTGKPPAGFAVSQSTHLRLK